MANFGILLVVTICTFMVPANPPSLTLTLTGWPSLSPNPNPNRVAFIYPYP